MDAELHEAALLGNVDSLTTLLEGNPNILDTTADFDETSLHIAALFGHVEFAEKILNRKPDLAHALNSEKSSALHLASAKGHVEMVKLLLATNANMCFARDQDGMIPLHAAALKDRVEVMRELVDKNSSSIRVLTVRREPILHLCVNHNRFKAADLLLELANNVPDVEFVKMKDDDDNTILHLCIAKKHTRTVKYLVENRQVDVNAQNINGLTALDVLLQSPSEPPDTELEAILKGAGATSGEEMHPSRKKKKDHGKWLDETRSTLIVVAVLIATGTFQAGLNPPGGLWQDTGFDGEKVKHFAGEAIMSYRSPLRYTVFLIFNGIGFVASQLIILLLISGFPLQRRSVLWVFMVIMWVAVSSMVVTYTYVMSALTSYRVRHALHRWLRIPIAIFGWVALVGLLFLCHFLRLALTRLRKYGILQMRNRRRSMGRRNVV
ncbi:ankyrin repeat-containing protein BDA1-like [Magnolia sinica]|uniref:ankyrin repeat-containing protein BDA1-like n=1 Tax=Magnolia sinica TaxID=86752 RepID=UPI0026580047|nr:ankyrin repeat-containing protein BDA1-like [Magnolia sinica]